MNSPSRQMATVPNSLIGRLFIWYLKRHLNKATYTLLLRGRGKCREGHRDRYGLRAWQGSHVGIYLNERNPEACGWTASATWKRDRERREALKKLPPEERFKRALEDAGIHTASLNDLLREPDHIIPPNDFFRKEM